MDVDQYLVMKYETVHGSLFRVFSAGLYIYGYVPWLVIIKQSLAMKVSEQGPTVLNAHQTLS